MHKILVINPNSNDDVTAKLTTIFREYPTKKNTKVSCISLKEGPFGIETDDDIKYVAPLVLNEIKNKLLSFDAFIIACYSDPGLYESVLAFSVPIYGIHETTVKYCNYEKKNFGVIALGKDSIIRHQEYIDELSLKRFYIGEMSLDIDVDEAVNGEKTMERILKASKYLIEEKHAEIIILGCAGMARYRNSLEEKLGVTVLDPVQTSVDLAIWRLQHSIEGEHYE